MIEISNKEFFEGVKVRVEELKKKLDNNELSFVAQISQSSELDTIKYAVSISGFSDSLTPATFVYDSSKEIFDEIDKYFKDLDKDAIEIKYHEAQAYACLETAKRHREIIKEIKDRIKKDKKTKETK